MHQYLRAIGFSKLKNKIEENTLTNTILKDYTSWQEIDIASDITLIQIGRQIGNGIGYMQSLCKIRFCTGEGRAFRS